jgi:hypothetical protein
MISLFKDCHLRFHNQIRNIFKLIGSPDEEHIGRDTFPDFIRMVNPEIREVKIREMWLSMIQFDSGPERTTVPIQMFERFCGDYPGMTRWIEELPFLDGFDRVYKAMTEPMLTFFAFLRKRLTDFLPKFVDGLRQDLREAVMPYVRRMRNGFLRCEISTCTMCYRYIMQYVDLKLTEQNPFQIITSGITVEDVERLVNHVMMRETLAALLLGVPQEIDGDELMKKEAAFNSAVETKVPPVTEQGPEKEDAK